MVLALYFIAYIVFISWVIFRLARRTFQKNLKGEYVLITGGASGIGKSIAIKLAEERAHIILWDIDREKLEKSKAELEARGARVFGYQVDLSKYEEVKRVGQKTLEEVGRVDILVNNAGVVSGMKKRNHGHIVNVASMAGYVSVPKMTIYSASKFAAIGFNECLRVELKKLHFDGIHTTCVCPFYVNTGMFEGVKLNTLLSVLLPILEPEYVASRVVSAIKKRDEVIILPRLARLIFLIKLLPVHIQDWILSFVGIYDTMDTFAGLRSIRENERKV